ncbi:Crocetin glucosyltransferase [Spatholobus suberectus]|nr:Crocetin glucosyltransferase [Spatholobus suberectus]
MDPVNSSQRFLVASKSPTTVQTMLICCYKYERKKDFVKESKYPHYSEREPPRLASFSATMLPHRFLLVIYPAQGQLNPALQFAKRLIAMGACVTLPITLHVHRRCITNKTTIPGLSLAPFSDGYDHGLSFLLSPRDIPSFLLLWKPSLLSFVFASFEEQIKQLDLEANPTVLVNTFEALEAEALRAVDKLNMIPIGPLIPSAFLDGKDPDDTSFGGDLLPVSNDYVEWLDSKEEKSVVYVSFGSYFELSTRQAEEIAGALLDCGRSFLWVIREQEKELGWTPVLRVFQFMLNRRGSSVSFLRFFSLPTNLHSSSD